MRTDLVGRASLPAVLAFAACSGSDDATPRDCNSWRQWGNNASHDGASCVHGEPLHAVLSDMVYDPFLAQEVVDASGELIIHYQAPLIDGDDLYMMTKGGTYTPCHQDPMNVISCFDPDEAFRLFTQVWSEQHFTIDPRGSLALQWTYDSDWKPVPIFGFEPMFQPALAGDLIAIPGAGGAIWELDRVTGNVIRHVQPFADGSNIYVAGGIAAGRDGTFYYNALKFDPSVDSDAQAWLVAIDPGGGVRTADYATLVSGAPAMCFGTYHVQDTPLPWPPQDAGGAPLAPPMAPCGVQRPGVNITPAIGPDGTIFLATKAHLNERYSYVLAVNPDLSPKWSTSLRDYLRDGCGVTTASDGTATDKPGHCAVGTPAGVERVTGLLPAGLVNDESSSSPVALPDGGVLYGALTGYNGSRGHLFKLDRHGAIAASYDFGWDSTPAVIGSGSNYKIVIKDNHYAADVTGVPLGPFYITELDSSLHPVWQFKSTNTRSCVRLGDAMSCIDDHPNGFEWCINAVAVDSDGTVFVNSEDGNAYAITSSGELRDQIFLEKSIGAAYTPIALDRAGHVFTLNNGHLAVLGK